MSNKKVIDRGMIEDFGSAIDFNNFRNTVYYLSDYIDDIALDLSQSNQLIKIQNIELIPFGDFPNNTAITNSDIDLYLAVKSAQIELNSIGPMENKWNSFWNRVINAWKNRKGYKKIQKKAAKLAKKQAKTLTIEQLASKKEKPYTIISLKDDFFNELISQLTESTVLYNQQSRIRILAKEEFGHRINIYPAIKHDDGLKVWDSSINKFVLTKPLEAKSLLNEKNNEINEKNEDANDDIFLKTIRIFKNLYYNIQQSYNYQFVESLIYNCPNKLFISSKSTYDTFIKVLNYLNNTDISNYRSIYNDEKKIYNKDNLNLFNIRSFIKEINDYLI